LPSLSDERKGSHNRCVESGDINPSPLPHMYPAHGRAGAPRAAAPRAPQLYYTTGHESCRSTDGHVLGGRRTPLRLRRFVGRQTVPKGPRAARAPTLHHIHGADPLGAARGERRRARLSTVGREDNTPCDGADHSGLARYGVRERWAVSRAGAPPLTSGAERLINAGWVLLLVTAQVGGDIWQGVRDHLCYTRR
jgi:hypothetical protein